MKKEVYEIVEKYVIDNPKAKYTEIADMITDDDAVAKSHRTLRRYAKEVSDCLSTDSDTKAVIKTAGHPDYVKMNPGAPDIVFTDDEGKELESEVVIEPATNGYVDQDVPEAPLQAYDVETGEDIPNQPVSIYNGICIITDKYTFQHEKYEIVYQKVTQSFEASLIDEMFYGYSRKGMNLTKHQVIEICEIEVADFNLITNKLGLHKECEPYGPVADECFEVDTLHDLVSDMTGKLMEADRLLGDTVVDAVVRENKKQYAELVKKNLELTSTINKFVNRAVTTKKLSPIVDAKLEPLVVVLTDFHLGLKTDAFNMEIAAQKLATILGDIKDKVKPGQAVKVALLGDIMHSISGVQHPDIWQRIEEGAWGADMVIDAFELLAEFFLNIENLTEVYAVGGNHDRIQPDKRQEAESQGSKLLFYMLERALSAKVIYEDHTCVFDVGNVRYICVHGDQGLDRKSAQEISWMLGDQTKFNLILEGHYHTFFVPKNDTSANFMKMHCPSFCPQDQFAEKLGLDSMSGYVTITEKRGKPSITIEPLNYDN